MYVYYTLYCVKIRNATSTSRLKAGKNHRDISKSKSVWQTVKVEGEQVQDGVGATRDGSNVRRRVLVPTLRYCEHPFVPTLSSALQSPVHVCML